MVSSREKDTYSVSVFRSLMVNCDLVRVGEKSVWIDYQISFSTRWKELIFRNVGRDGFFKG